MNTRSLYRKRVKSTRWLFRQTFGKNRTGNRENVTLPGGCAAGGPPFTLYIKDRKEACAEGPCTAEKEKSRKKTAKKKLLLQFSAQSPIIKHEAYKIVQTGGQVLQHPPPCRKHTPSNNSFTLRMQDYYTPFSPPAQAGAARFVCGQARCAVRKRGSGFLHLRRCVGKQFRHGAFLLPP